MSYNSNDGRPKKRTFSGTRTSDLKIQGKGTVSKYGKRGQTVQNLQAASAADRNKARPNHNHDERYYTEVEVDALIAQLQTDVRQVEQQATVAVDLGNIDEDLLPETGNTYNIGSEASPFLNLYLGGNINLWGESSAINFIDPSRSLVYSSSNDNLTVNLGSNLGRKMVVKGSVELDGMGTSIMFNDGTTLSSAPVPFDNLTDIADVNPGNDTVQDNMLLQYNTGEGWVVRDGFAKVMTASATQFFGDSVTAKDYLILGDSGNAGEDVILDLQNLAEPTEAGMVLQTDGGGGSVGVSWMKPATHDHVHNFLQLTDTPSSYTGQNGDYLTVSGGTIAFTAFPTLYLDASLADTDITNEQNNDVLRWDGSNWVNTNSISLFSLISDNVHTDSLVVDEELALNHRNYQIGSLGVGLVGEVLRIKPDDEHTLEWTHMPTKISELSDAGNDTWVQHDIFRFNGSQWFGTRDLDGLLTVESDSVDTNLLGTKAFKFMHPSTGITTATVELPAGSPSNNQVLKIDTGSTPDQFVWTTLELDSLEDVDLATVPPASESVLKYNGTQWTPSDSITGLSMLGTFDVNATNVVTGNIAVANAVSLDNISYNIAALGQGIAGQVLGVGAGGNSLAWLNNSPLNSFEELSDTPNNYTGDAGKILKVNANENALEYATTTDWDDAFSWGDHSTAGYAAASSLIDEFTGLTDTPNTFTGHAGKYVIVNSGGTALEFTSSTNNAWNHNMTQHILPDTNASYDIGSAEYKIRHLFLSDNSMWLGDATQVSANTSGDMVLRTRKLSTVPAGITAEGGDSAGALAHSGKGSLKLMKLNEWIAYGQSLNASFDMSDLYPPVGHANYDADDYTSINTQKQNGQKFLSEQNGAGPFALDLKTSSRAFVEGPTGDWGLDITNTNAADGVSFKAKVLVVLKGIVANLDINAVTVNGVQAHITQVNAVTPSDYSMVTYNFEFMRASGHWFGNVYAQAGTKNTGYQTTIQNQNQNNPN